MKNSRPTQNLIQKLAAGKLFSIISVTVVIVHLCAYVAAFVKLIMIEAGGYYDSGVIVFLGMTIISMPLFAIELWLIRHSVKISKRQRFWGYITHCLTFAWSISIVKISYFM
jgi:hypothetical protein